MTLRKLLGAALVLSSAGCYSISPLAKPGAYITEKQPPLVWVADTAGEVIRVEGPSVRGDSVVGTLQGTTEPIAVELTPEHAVFARQKSTRKTVELVGGISLLAGLATYGFIKGQGGPEDCVSLGSNPTGRPYC